MANVFDYIKWRGDLTFTQDPPNAVDALIFSALSYIRFGGQVETEPHTPVLLRDAAEVYFALDDHEERIRVKNDLELLHEAARSIRFGLTKLYLYRDLFVPEQETQFAAVTFLLDDGSAFLAFRGTDYSLVGWKEDFNMSFQQTIPAQRLALQYTREVAAEYTAPLRLGGHSKGGVCRGKKRPHGPAANPGGLQQRWAGFYRLPYGRPRVSCHGPPDQDVRSAVLGDRDAFGA